jgi:hypothetical protein
MLLKVSYVKYDCVVIYVYIWMLHHIHILHGMTCHVNSYKLPK